MLQPLVGGVLKALAERLAASQQDQEVKEAAIACTGMAVACLGDTSPKQTTQLLEVCLWLTARTCLAAAAVLVGSRTR